MHNNRRFFYWTKTKLIKIVFLHANNVPGASPSPPPAASRFEAETQEDSHCINRIGTSVKKQFIGFQGGRGAHSQSNQRRAVKSFISSGARASRDWFFLFCSFINFCVCYVCNSIASRENSKKKKIEKKRPDSSIRNRLAGESIESDGKSLEGLGRECLNKEKNNLFICLSASEVKSARLVERRDKQSESGLCVWIEFWGKNPGPGRRRRPTTSEIAKLAIFFSNIYHLWKRTIDRGRGVLLNDSKKQSESHYMNRRTMANMSHLWIIWITAFLMHSWLGK